MGAIGMERVVSVHHWTDWLFSFRLTRDPSFRFKNGQFTMLGLPFDGKPLLRAYSMASANHEEELEFFSFKVPDGPLTSRLRHLEVGDEVLVGRKPTGTLIQDNLLPGRRLFLLGTGTGLAPFLSIIQDPEIYDAYESVVLVHGVRQVAELAYRDMITNYLPNHEFLGEYILGQLKYYPAVTREAFQNRGRVTDLLRGGKMLQDLGECPFDRDQDRFMICGGQAMLRDTVDILESWGCTEGSGHAPGHFAIEKAFVTQDKTPVEKPARQAQAANDQEPLRRAG